MAKRSKGLKNPLLCLFSINRCRDRQFLSFSRDFPKYHSIDFSMLNNNNIFSSCLEMTSKLWKHLCYHIWRLAFQALHKMEKKLSVCNCVVTIVVFFSVSCNRISQVGGIFIKYIIHWYIMCVSSLVYWCSNTRKDFINHWRNYNITKDTNKLHKGRKGNPIQK